MTAIKYTHFQYVFPNKKIDHYCSFNLLYTLVRAACLCPVILVLVEKFQVKFSPVFGFLKRCFGHGEFVIKYFSMAGNSDIIRYPVVHPAY